MTKAAYRRRLKRLYPRYFSEWGGDVGPVRWSVKDRAKYLKRRAASSK